MWNINFQAEAKILRGPHEDLESYLEAVEQLRSIIQFFTGNKNFKSGIGIVNQANSLLGKAILKLEEEFRQLLTSYRFCSLLPCITLVVILATFIFTVVVIPYINLYARLSTIHAFVTLSYV